MRIISGKFKGRRFEPPKNFKARPTTDFAKENLFNILNNELSWDSIVSLDLFAGTGGISFELVSRGGLQITTIEKSPVHAEFISKTGEKLGITEMRILRVDAFKYLEGCNKERFDFIFADPPYDMENFEQIPKLVLDKGILNDGGVFVMEHSKEYDFSALPHFSEKRVYGSVNFSFFRK